jgi:hypothetical protein
LQIQWIKNILSSIVPIFDNRLADITVKYIQSDIFSSAYGLSLGYIERQLSFILVFIFYPRLKKDDQNVNIFTNLFYLYCFTFLLCSEMSILLERVALLFVCSYWILYPKIFNLISKKYKYVFLFLLLIYSVPKIKGNHYGRVHEYDNVLTGYKSFEIRLDDYRYWRMNDSKRTLKAKNNNAVR